MTREEFAKTIDYAMLWQNTPRDLLKKRCENVVKYGFACICCFPSDVQIAREIIGDKGGVCAVVGYPMGMNTVSYTHLDVYKRQEPRRSRLSRPR